MIYTVTTGSNIFRPIRPILPYLNRSYSFWLRIGSEWKADHLTTPDHYGVKLPAIGRFNYHSEGANFAIIDGLKLITRYYKNGILHQNDIQFVQLKPDTWYHCRIDLNQLTFIVDGKTLCTYPEKIRSGWITPPYCGKTKLGTASRNLKLEIK